MRIVLSVHQKIIAYVIAGTILGAIAVVGLNVWLEAGWFVDIILPSDWVGYNVTQFIGLLGWIVLCPTAFSMLFIGLQQTIRWEANRVGRARHIAAVAFGVSALLAIAGWAVPWAREILICGGIACIDPEKWTPPFPPRGNEMGFAWKATLAIQIVFTFGGLAFALLFGYLCRYKAPEWQAEAAALDAEAPFMERDHLPFMYRRRQSREWLLLFVYLIGLGLFAGTTTYIPNAWQSMSPAGIASFASKSMTHNATLCGKPSKLCPEYDTATFKTINVQISDVWVAKLFPSNMFFFGLLAIAPTLAMIIRSCECCAGRCRGMVRVPCTKRFWQYGELGMLLLVLGFLTLWTFYWLVDHNYNGNWDGPSGNHNISPWERWARGLGQVGVVLMSLLMWPAARNSLVPIFFGTSWESSIKYHRWLGYLFLLVVIGHMVMNWIWQYKYGELHFFQVPSHYTNGADNFTIPLMTLLFWLALLAMIPAVYEPLRRKRWELFKNLHHLAYTTLIPGVLWHAAAAWEFLLPGVALWLVDRIVRAYRSSRGVRVLEFTPIDCGVAGHVVRLRVRAAGAVDRFAAGQYCFLNVAELSLYEWHPFTIASMSARVPGELEFIIKSSGYATWTSRLYGMANAHVQRHPGDDNEHAPSGNGRRNGGSEMRHPSSDDNRSQGLLSANGEIFDTAPALTLSIDGPYGGKLEMSAYHTVVLLAGGIGITPVKSHFDTIRAAYRHSHAASPMSSPDYILRGDSDKAVPSIPSRVHLLWTIRDPALALLMKDSFEEPVGPGTPFTARLFLSQRGQWEAEQRDMHGQDLPRSLANLLVRKRPDLEVELEKGISHHDGSRGAPRTLLFVCGPDSMVADARVVAARHGWDFHEETFEL